MKQGSALIARGRAGRSTAANRVQEQHGLCEQPSSDGERRHSDHGTELSFRIRSRAG